MSAESDAISPSVLGGWNLTRLGDLAVHCGNGFGRRGGNVGTPAIVLRLADIIGGRVSTSSVRRICATDGEVEQYALRPSDLLVVRVNGSPELVGRVIHFDGAGEPVLFCDHFIRLRLHDPDIAKFVRYFAETGAVRNYVDQFKVSSAGQNTVSQRTILALSVPLPPLAEQKRIVAKVEEVLARVNAARERLVKLPTILKRFRQSVLAAACSGRLTADWRQQQRRLPGAGELAADWRVAPFEEVTINHDGKRVPIKAEDRLKRRGQYSYYGASGAIDTIDDFLFDGSFLLIGEDGANLLMRSTPIAHQAHGRFWVNNHAHVVTGREGLSIDYLEMFINSIDLTDYVTGSAQPKLTQRALNAIPVKVPPADEQAVIVSRLRKLFDLAVTSSNKIASALRMADKLVQSTLAKAFRGELVPTEAELAEQEGRKSETAQELLERIRASRESETPKPGRSRGRRRAGKSENGDDAASFDETLFPDAATQREPASQESPRQTQAATEPAESSNGSGGQQAKVGGEAGGEISYDDAMASVREAFAEGGARDREQALRDVATALRHQRIGTRVRETIDGYPRAAVRRGILASANGQYVLVARGAAGYTRDHLIERLIASMNGGWTDRDEAVRATARHLGFRKAGSAFREAMESAINGAIRRGLLDYEGEVIRKA